MTMNYHKLNQLVTSIVVTFLDVVLLLDQISTFLAYSINLENAFFFVPVGKNHQKQMAFIWQESKTPSLCKMSFIDI